MAYENYTQNSEGFVGFSGHLEHFNPQFGIVKLGDNRATGFGVFAGFTGTDAGSTRHVVNLPPGLRSSGYVAVIFENGEPVLKMYKGTALIAAGDTVTYNGTTATAASFIGFPSDTHWQDPSYWVTVEEGRPLAVASTSKTRMAMPLEMRRQLPSDYGYCKRGGGHLGSFIRHCHIYDWPA